MRHSEPVAMARSPAALKNVASPVPAPPRVPDQPVMAEGVAARKSSPTSGVASTRASSVPSRQRAVALVVRLVEISGTASTGVAAPKSIRMDAAPPVKRARSRGCGSRRLAAGMPAAAGVSAVSATASRTRSS
ncbi:hypothetical protein [Sediminicoccus sp. BL-A-41-H5]|uniref:hypothetical protein n=1 Tax=Sediminicoccus sp. BL-A-41-H5 TaxID=3421106 RepID=UPI003D66B0B1